MSSVLSRPLSAVTAIAITVLLVASAAGAPLAAANTANSTQSAGPQISLSNVEITPSQPGPGDLVEISAEISNAAASSESAEVRTVRLESRSGFERFGQVRNLGTLTPGGSVNAPLTTTFEEPGVKKLQLTVSVETADDELVQFHYPVTVVVSESGPKMSIDVAGSVGKYREIAVNVSNGQREAIRNLDLTVDGRNVRIDDPERLDAKLEPGTKRTFTYSGSVPDGDTASLTAVLEYTNTMGQTQELERTVSLDTPSGTAAVDGPQLALSVADGLPGTTRPVNVTVANGLDGDLSQVEVAVDSPVATFTASERVTSRLQAGETTDFRFPARVAESGTYPVTVTLNYTDDGTRKQVTDRFQAAFDAPPNPGDVVLTGVEAVARGGTVEITATASNVGSDEVKSVIVSTGEAENVGRKKYFVGSVDASDFSSFTLTPSIRGNVSTVPVEVSYVVDGVRRNYTTELPVTQAAMPDRSPQRGGLPIVPIVVLVALIAAVVIYRRRG
ncbi:hypothetical protein ACOZ4N_06995 [Halorientalis pallida]|uniref:hypothetical protein n=1 Tax=Halorientalis pallida TaxID=2479928 RepID=UPI003C6F820C